MTFVEARDIFDILVCAGAIAFVIIMARLD